MLGCLSIAEFHWLDVDKVIDVFKEDFLHPFALHFESSSKYYSTYQNNGMVGHVSCLKSTNPVVRFCIALVTIPGNAVSFQSQLTNLLPCSSRIEDMIGTLRPVYGRGRLCVDHRLASKSTI